ncbi:MAG: NAD(+) synthase [Thermodesulfovibrionales bacterium]|nr:NAD(+) synthase [Thermodesulfovibrionales bacterium]
MPYGLTKKQADRVISNIRKLIGEYFRSHGLKYAVFGKSEGLDSSVIAGILSKIPGVRPIGVILPCESDTEAERIARIVLDHYKIPHIKVDLTREYHDVMGQFYASDGVHGQISEVLRKYRDKKRLASLAHIKGKASGNIKARLRMITLYHIAQLTGGAVFSTDNISELWMGFWTLNGDVGDIAPIQHVFKGLEEYDMAKALGVPKESLECVPTDGLDVVPGGCDEDQLGMPYEELDKVIIKLLQSKFDGTGDWSDKKISNLSRTVAKELGKTPESVEHVARQLYNTRFKRDWPLIFTRQEIGLPPVEDIKL